MTDEDFENRKAATIKKTLKHELEYLVERMDIHSQLDVEASGGYPDDIKIIGNKIVVATVEDRSGVDNKPVLEIYNIEEARDYVFERDHD